jgi:hypothetical protein
MATPERSAIARHHVCQRTLCCNAAAAGQGCLLSSFHTLEAPDTSPSLNPHLLLHLLAGGQPHGLLALVKLQPSVAQQQQHVSATRNSNSLQLAHVITFAFHNPA